MGADTRTTAGFLENLWVSEITDEELVEMAAYVREATGIALDETKGYLLESRLRPLIESFGMKSYGELVAAAKKNLDINNALIDAIATHETYFFRDNHPFELFRNKLIPDLLKKNPADCLYVASAACATGQEAYSMAMALQQMHCDLAKNRIRILGYDISQQVISKANKGEYTRFEVSRGLDSAMVERYFTKEGDIYRVKDELRAMVSFRRANLLSDSLGIQRFHIVFCRNVANYFLPQDRVRLFGRLTDCLVPGGVLVIGGAESLTGEVGDRFNRNEFQGSICYQKRE